LLNKSRYVSITVQMEMETNCMWMEMLFCAVWVPCGCEARGISRSACLLQLLF